MKFIFSTYSVSSYSLYSAFTFSLYRKKGLNRNIRLISKILTSQTGQQTVAIHILPNITRSKGNQTTNVGRLIEYNKINIFLQKSCRKWNRDTGYSPVFLSFTQGKRKWSAAQFHYILIALNFAYNRNKLYKPLDY